MAPDEVCESREADGSAQDTAKSENPHPATTGLGPWQIVVWLALGLAIVVPLTALVSESLFRTVFGWCMVVALLATSMAIWAVSVSVAFKHHVTGWQIVVWLVVGLAIVVTLNALVSDSHIPILVWCIIIFVIPVSSLSGAFRYHGPRRRIEIVVRAISSCGILTAIALSSTLSTPMFMLLFGMSMGLDIVKDYFVERWYPETPKD